jgi:hypothetical protein
MADASWVHLGRDYAYGLIVEGRIVELTAEMAEEELGQTAGDALEVIANEVLAEGRDE